MRKGRVIRACCVTACAHACTRHVPGSYANEIIHPTAIAIKQSLSARRNPRRLRTNPGEVKLGYGGYNSLCGSEEKEKAEGNSLVGLASS